MASVPKEHESMMALARRMKKSLTLARLTSLNAQAEREMRRLEADLSAFVVQTLNRPVTREDWDEPAKPIRIKYDVRIVSDSRELGGEP